jgi:AmiR/NasT family two-component response regulator
MKTPARNEASGARSRFSARILVLEQGDGPHGELVARLIGLNHRVATSRIRLREALRPPRQAELDVVMLSLSEVTDECLAAARSLRSAFDLPIVLIVSLAATVAVQAVLDSIASASLFAPYTTPELNAAIMRAIRRHFAGGERAG